MVDGVYKAGFATTQAAYEKVVHLLFQSLDRVEKILGEQEYLVGNTMTEADVRLFVTIAKSFPVSLIPKNLTSHSLKVRFDPVYFGHFKCNVRDIRHGYPAIHA
jgi:putative glutathione S-transferase